MGRQVSEVTRARISAKQKVKGAQRSAQTAEKVRAAMRVVDASRARNEGPHLNKGDEVSWAEVARLAGVHETTLYSPKQTALRGEVDAWLKAAKPAASQEPQSPPKRRPLATRIAELEGENKALSQRFHLVELELQDQEAEVLRLRTDLAKQVAANERLAAELTEYKRGKLVSIQSKRRRESDQGR